jgi:hypothetical protein
VYGVRARPQPPSKHTPPHEPAHSTRLAHLHSRTHRRARTTTCRVPLNRTASRRVTHRLQCFGACGPASESVGPHPLPAPRASFESISVPNPSQKECPSPRSAPRCHWDQPSSLRSPSALKAPSDEGSRDPGLRRHIHTHTHTRTPALATQLLKNTPTLSLPGSFPPQPSP